MYAPFRLPPQEDVQAYVCPTCSAVVLDPTKHSSTHTDRQRDPRRQPRVPNVIVEQQQ